MDTQEFDVVVVGAGMAGCTAAAQLSAGRRVALIEAEETPGYHATGRSAAIWVQNYGPADVREFTRLSRAFYENPPPGFSDSPLIRQRPVLTLAGEAQQAELAEAVARGIGLRPIGVRQARRMVPAIRPGYLAAAALEEDAFDMDVAAIQQGFLRLLRASGGVLALRRRAGLIGRHGGLWSVETSNAGLFRAPVLVDAAGAWGDEVAALAGVVPLGLTPRRRTAAIINPAPFDVTDWPMIYDVGEAWYARPEARTRLMVSPADATPTHAHDVQPEEIDVASGIERMQQALDIEVRHIEHRWAGLRTFTPDGSLALGWDAAAPGFFWSVGQGGYGIQTAPAVGRFVADMILGRDPGVPDAHVAAVAPGRFRS